MVVMGMPVVNDAKILSPTGRMVLFVVVSMAMNVVLVRNEHPDVEVTWDEDGMA